MFLPLCLFNTKVLMLLFKWNISTLYGSNLCFNWSVREFPTLTHGGPVSFSLYTNELSFEAYWSKSFWDTHLLGNLKSTFKYDHFDVWDTYFTQTKMATGCPAENSVFSAMKPCFFPSLLKVEAPFATGTW